MTPVPPTLATVSSPFAGHGLAVNGRSSLSGTPSPASAHCRTTRAMGMTASPRNTRLAMKFASYTDKTIKRACGSTPPSRTKRHGKPLDDEVVRRSGPPSELVGDRSVRDPDRKMFTDLDEDDERLPSSSPDAAGPSRASSSSSSPMSSSSSPICGTGEERKTLDRRLAARGLSKSCESPGSESSSSPLLPRPAKVSLIGANAAPITAEPRRSTLDPADEVPPDTAPWPGVVSQLGESVFFTTPLRCSMPPTAATTYGSDVPDLSAAGRSVARGTCRTTSRSTSSEEKPSRSDRS
mmetsp:Transcript_2894/g.9448  ORF Transcript_2894/g.9448 Transcript_2894/m.9448 type:complete len:295 (+) Transcript_2894:285-1169(+)